MKHITRPSQTVRKYPAKDWQNAHNRKLRILARRIERGIDKPLFLFRIGVVSTGELYRLQRMLKCKFQINSDAFLMP